MPGVGRLPSENRRQVRLGHLPPLVDWRAGADARDQVAVFLDVRIEVLERCVLPGAGTSDCIEGVGAPARALEIFPDATRRPLLLTTERGHAATVGILELDGEVIIAVSIQGIGARLTPAARGGAHGMPTHHPVGNVDVVHVLFHDVVAGGPRVVEPVAELVLGVAPLGLARVAPEPALVPVHLPRDHLTDRTVVDALDGLDVSGVVAALRAGDVREPLGLGDVGGGDGLERGHDVNGNRLFRKDVLPGLYRCSEMLCAERWGRGDDDEVAVGGHHAAKGVPSGEHRVVRHLVGGGEGGVLGRATLERASRTRHPVVKEVAERGDVDVRARSHRITDGADTAPAASNDANPNRRGALPPNGKGLARECKGSGGGGRRLDKRTTGEMLGHGILTRRKPAKGPSESHQRLLGSCGSVAFQLGTCRSRRSGASASTVVR